GGEMFQERRCQAGLPNAWLTGQQHYLTLTGLCLRPSAQQQFEFFFPSDEISQSGPMQRFKMACSPAGSQCCPNAPRSRDPLQVLCPKVLELKQIAEEASRAFCDDHLVRFGAALQTRREVRRLADDTALLRPPRIGNFPDHDQSGGDANPRLQRSPRP